MQDEVIRVEELRKSYGSTVAVDGVSFEVGRGEIFGVVGPNGAGKTTTVECLIGLRSPDSGAVSVLGLDPLRRERELRRRVGVQLQQAALPDRMKVREALELYASFYRGAVKWGVLLEQWGLEEKRNTYFSDLSGGQRQRLFVALALLNDPEVVFLDEITSGLDPQARRATWDLVRDVRERGKTVVLVTHFMDEAEMLCDRVAVIDRGRVVALDSPQRIVRGLGLSSSVSFTAPRFDPESLRGSPGVSRVVREGERITVYGDETLLLEVASALAEEGIVPHDLRARQPTLEDAFLALTGRGIRD